ncbi:hypothetical protein [Chitinilyticum aquatile]|uniref:hypothetical protein n=1 Tax=Chitinilyticum aquatile TaxID=362520 RepID=UPI0004060A0D|nr:hypothetical protein [Chitinilyticum aquatile]
MKKSLQFLLARLREPSTWAGAAAAGVAFGMSGDKANALINLGPVVAGVVACFLPDPSSPSQE